MVNLLQSIAHELHDLERTRKRLAKEPRPTRRHEVERLEIAVRIEECLRELAALDVELVHDTPVTFHLQALDEHGNTLTLCWVTGERSIEYYHAPGASPGTARQRLPC